MGDVRTHGGFLSLGIANGQSRGLPRRDAASNFTYGIKSPALQQARGDGRPIAARTVDQQAAVFRERFQILRQTIERYAQAAADVFLFPLTRRPDVDGQGG